LTVYGTHDTNYVVYELRESRTHTQTFKICNPTDAMNRIST